MAAAGIPRAVQRGADPDPATADQAVAGDGGTRAGSVLRPETHAGAAVRVGLHAHDRVGDHARGADVRAPGVPLRADVLELGDGHDLLFGEPGEPQRRMAERGVGIGSCRGRAPHRQPVERTNPASPNENGDAEQSHHRFKRAVEQALLLRGSRDFGSVAEYRQFLKDLFVQRNAGRRSRLAEEMAVMGELPARRMESARRERVKVDSDSLIHVERNLYSVNSRLIGAQVEARMYLDQRSPSTAQTMVVRPSEPEAFPSPTSGPRSSF